MKHNMWSFPFRHCLLLGGLIVWSAVTQTPCFALSADDVNQAMFSEAVARENPQRLKPGSNSNLPDPAIVKAQTLLGRMSLSPGVIDGFDGDNFRKALSEFKRRSNLPRDDMGLDAATWSALGASAATDIVAEYVLTEDDAKYPFADTQKDYKISPNRRRLATEISLKC